MQTVFNNCCYLGSENRQGNTQNRRGKSGRLNHIPASLTLIVTKILENLKHLRCSKAVSSKAFDARGTETVQPVVVLC